MKSVICENNSYKYYKQILNFFSQIGIDEEDIDDNYSDNDMPSKKRLKYTRVLNLVFEYISYKY